MNIDSITRLIESSDVAVFRTLAAQFMPMIGLNTADFCDGSYDGGKDFTIIKNLSGIEIGIQLSVEKDWKKKIKSDAIKTKNNYQTNLLYFLSSRRIPEASFRDFSNEILQTTGVAVTKYDNQAIASNYIKTNKVNDLLKIYGIEAKAVPERINKYLGAKNEAISALLLFGQDSKDFRMGLFDSIIKSIVARKDSYNDREILISDVLAEYHMGDTQSVLVNSHIDRLLQRGELISSEGIIKLSKNEQKSYKGLIESSQYEAKVLYGDISSYLTSMNANINEECKEILLENYLNLTIALISKSYSINGERNGDNEAYTIINDLLISKEGSGKAKELFSGLTNIVSQSEFAKHIASAKLYEILLNSNSAQLISAFGGSESLNVYIDSSVVIPIICGLLFETTKNRFSQSANSLYRLIKGHEFSAIIPEDYIEETSAHLINACRDYKSILEEGIDLTYSENAFVSHYSSYIKTEQGNETSFSDYVSIFGIRLDNLSKDISGDAFFSLRNRVSTQISNILQKYDFSVEKIKIPYTQIQQEIDKIKKLLESQRLFKPDVLINHAARVIKYLSGNSIPSGYARLLCIWEKIHIQLNPDGLNGYYVMNPIALIDYLSIAKHSSSEYPLSHLVDFAFIQSTNDLELSSKIWDAIAKIEKGGFSDAMLMITAKKFKEKFLESYLNHELIPEDIEQSWMAWKKTTVTQQKE